MVMSDYIYPRASGALSGPQTPSHKGPRRGRQRINLPATFQFSPATSKSTDIPDYVWLHFQFFLLISLYYFLAV